MFILTSGSLHLAVFWYHRTDYRPKTQITINERPITEEKRTGGSTRLLYGVQIMQSTRNRALHVSGTICNLQKNKVTPFNVVIAETKKAKKRTGVQRKVESRGSSLDRV